LKLKDVFLKCFGRNQCYDKKQRYENKSYPCDAKMNPSRKISNFLAYDFDAALKFVRCEKQKRGLSVHENNVFLIKNLMGNSQKTGILQHFIKFGPKYFVVRRESLSRIFTKIKNMINVKMNLSVSFRSTISLVFSTQLFSNIVFSL